MNEYYSNALFKKFHDNNYVFIPSGESTTVNTVCVRECMLIINKNILDASLPFHYKKQLYTILDNYAQCDESNKKYTHYTKCNKLDLRKCVLIGILLLNHSKKDIETLYFYKSYDEGLIKVCNYHGHEITCNF